MRTTKPTSANGPATKALLTDTSDCVIAGSSTPKSSKIFWKAGMILIIRKVATVTPRPVSRQR